MQREVRDLSIKVADPAPAGVVAVRRQPAEGGDRQGADDRAEGAADGRAEPRHRHRRERPTSSASCAGWPRRGSASCSSRPTSTRSWRSPTAIAVMSQGRLTALFDRAEATEAKIVAASSIGHGPAAAHSAARKFPHERRRAIARPPSPAGSSLTLNLMRLRTFIALFAVLVYFSLRRAELPYRGQSRARCRSTSRQNAFLAIGMTFVIITGGIDLSVGVDRRPVRAWSRAA